MATTMKMNLIVLTLLALLATGCGYTFQGSATSLPADVKSVFISPVSNFTTETGLSLEFTEALRARFERYGIVQVVDREDRADSILAVRVLSLRSRAQSVTGSTGLELQQQLTMLIAGELRTKGGQLLWKNDGLEVADTFGSVSNTVVTSSSSFAQGPLSSETLGSLESREVLRGQQREALGDLIEEAARKIYLESAGASF